MVIIKYSHYYLLKIYNYVLSDFNKIPKHVEVRRLYFIISYNYVDKWICTSHNNSNQIIPNVFNTFSIIEILVKYGINVNKKNYFGETAIHLLCIKRIPDEEFSNCLKFLIDNGGGDINSHDNFDMTPLHHAIMINQCNNYIPILIQNGAELNSNRELIKTAFNSYSVHSQKYFESLRCCMDSDNRRDGDYMLFRNKYKNNLLKYYVYLYSTDVYSEFSYLSTIIAIANRNNFDDIINYFLDNSYVTPKKMLYYLCKSRSVCSQFEILNLTESERLQCQSYFGNDIFVIFQRILYFDDCPVEWISFTVTEFLSSIIEFPSNIFTIANDSSILTAFYYSNLRLDYTDKKLKSLFHKTDKTVCEICTVHKENSNCESDEQNVNKIYCEHRKINVCISNLFALCLIRGETDYKQRLNNICAIPEYGNSQCFKELINLYKIKFDNNTTTILQFLLANQFRSAFMVRNADIVEQLSSTDSLKKIAPIYCDILQWKLKDSLQRHKLIHDTTTEMITTFNSKYLDLPDIPLSIICNLLLNDKKEIIYLQKQQSVAVTNN